MKHKPINNDKILDSINFGIGDNAVSHTETTGLIPAAAQSEDELHSYLEVDEYRQKPVTHE